MESSSMLTALILVCSLATVSNDCTRDNALDVVYVPATFASSVACLMHAQAYAAGSSIGRDLPQNEAIKVICVPDPINSVDKAESRPSWAHLSVRARRRAVAPNAIVCRRARPLRPPYIPPCSPPPIANWL